MGSPVRVVSCPHLTSAEARFEHLWILVGGDGHFHKATAFYIETDRDRDGEDVARTRFRYVIDEAQEAGLTVEWDDLEEALSEYRRSRLT